MKKTMLLLALAAGAAAAHAGPYTVLQDSQCALVSAEQLAAAIGRAGAATGLALAKDMALRAELQCAVDGKTAGRVRYAYTMRVALDKQVADGEMLRWTPVAHLTGYGSATDGKALLRQASFTLRDLIRQEP
ncbi:MAG TPA: hypothetical protein VIL30_12060 [Ramlibacter sp.]|jgi:hypothetical protein